MDAGQVDYLMRTRGWVKFEGVLDAARVAALAADSATVYDKRRVVQVTNGVAANMEGAAHHVLGEHTSLDRFIDDLPLYDVIERHFGGKTILLNFGATLHPPGSNAYTQKPHRDVRAYSKDYRLSLNMLVMLDDFTLENGATRLLEGSHHVEAMPPAGLFAEHAISLTGKAGDIVLFDSLVVHSAAPNLATAQRRALTLCFGRPFMKPQMDWPRFLSDDAEARLSPTARQLLGFHAKVSAGVEDYYQPPERWAFKADQV
jgi:hypothetical protein